MSKSILDNARKLIKPELKELGLELVEIEYLKEGLHWYLRIYIDKEGGVDIDDCAEASHKIGEVLDRGNLITQAYTLEVSSPGIERPLRTRTDYEKYKGKLVSIYSLKPIQGYTRFTGHLKGLIDNKVILEYKNKEIAIPLESVERAHLTFEF